MSRIEKALEVAAQKRSETHEGRLEVQSLPLPKAERGKVRTGDGNITAVNSSSPFLATLNDQSSPAAEQYRRLKSLIVKLSQKGDFQKALMVTSPVAGEGKTITSLNLAISMAQEFDHTVLLVEADIRKPSVLNYLGIEAKRGLTDCVVDGLDVNDVLIKTDIGSLSILPAGRKVGNPVEIFSSNRMNAIFDEIRTRYNDRYVIVDTTPLLPFAEPQYIANAIGAVLLVVREGLTTPDKLKRSIEILKNNNLLGVVSNGVSRLTSMQGYYGYYGYR